MDYILKDEIFESFFFFFNDGGDPYGYLFFS